ncbi:MAG: low molecular weight protein-tyrosine-phosphatase [Burkholderiales bacterium]
MRILMVCMGNICRSPTAEVVMRHRLRQRGLETTVNVDSAGTHANQLGHAADERAIAHAARRGYDLRGMRARRVEAADFMHCDLVLAMDGDNLAALRAACDPAHLGKLRGLMAFAPAGSPASVPDPYYGGAAGFERVLDLIELGCDGLVEYLHLHRG